MAFSDLRAGGIVVRPWGPGDEIAYRAIQDDADVRRWSPVLHPKSADEVTAGLAREVEAGPGGGPGGFAVADADSGRVLGDVSYRLDLPAPPFRIADVGYCVLPAARGRGVASDALRLLTAWLLDPGGADLVRVQLDHAVENVASCRTAARAGFAGEGVRTGYLPLRADDGSPVVLHDTCLHGRIRA